MNWELIYNLNHLILIRFYNMSESFKARRWEKVYIKEKYHYFVGSTIWGWEQYVYTNCKIYPWYQGEK